MRVLNTNIRQQRKFSRFAVPGFRSGSVFKRIVAMLYYCFTLIFMCVLTINFASGDFANAGDVILLVAVELVILAIFLTPVIAIGFSDHYDWHGIKLFLVIMIPLCVLFTLGQWMCTLFSITYIESVNPSQKQIEQVQQSDSQAGSDAIIEAGIVEQGIKEEAAKSDASKKTE